MPRFVAKKIVSQLRFSVTIFQAVTIFHERPGTKFSVPSILQRLEFLGYQASRQQDGGCSTWI